MSSSYVSVQGMFALVFWRLALEAPSTQSILRSSDSYTEYSPPDIKHIQRSLHIVGYLPYCRSTMHGVGHSLTLDGTASDYQQRGVGEGNSHPTTLFVLLSTTWSSKSIIITSVITNVLFTADSHLHKNTESSHSALVMMINIITLIIIYSFSPS